MTARGLEETDDAGGPRWSLRGSGLTMKGRFQRRVQRQLLRRR